jgi:hypothetical protein
MRNYRNVLSLMSRAKQSGILHIFLLFALSQLVMTGKASNSLTKCRDLRLRIDSSRDPTLMRAVVHRRKLVGPEKVSNGSIDAKDRNCDS